MDRLHDFAIGQHGDDRLDIRTGLARIGEGRAAIRLRSVERVRAQVEGVHRMPRLHEIRGHPAAHIAEADEGDFHVLSPVRPKRAKHPNSIIIGPNMSIRTG
jgi:hypothetical protein